MPEMTRWEYLTRHYYGRTENSLTTVLAQLGDDGWELVTVDWAHDLLVFKRPGGGA
jgi:hypothetical protein